MEININRLKILSEEEIKRLDLKIEEYKNGNQISILDKSISEINMKISDMNTIYHNLNSNIISKIKQLELLTKQFNDNKGKYEIYNKRIDNLRKSIEKLNEELIINNDEEYKLKYIEEIGKIKLAISQLENELN